MMRQPEAWHAFALLPGILNSRDRRFFPSEREQLKGAYDRQRLFACRQRLSVGKSGWATV
jgi:hypothetical protein